MSDLQRLQIEVDAAAYLEAGVYSRGKPTDIYPDWVYEARDAIRRQNENPPPWLPDLLAALGWQGGTIHGALKAVQRLAAPDRSAPIDMVLPCPRCGMLHVDAPEPASGWTNPPHKSHLCHGCGLIWRPADVPTNGVAAVRTRGEKDSPLDPTLTETVVSRAHRLMRDMESLGQLVGRLTDAEHDVVCERVGPLVESLLPRLRASCPKQFGGGP